MENNQKKSDGETPAVDIPSQIFRDRSLSVLEILVEYLKEKKEMSFHQIAVLLNRDDRTIWTVYNRARKKRGKLGEQK